MKRLTWMALAVSTACVSTKTIPPVTVVTELDLRRYAQHGFLFSPDPYSGQFDALGFVKVTEYDGLEWSTQDDEWHLIPVRTTDVIDSAYARATGIGADALVRMDIRVVESAGDDPEWRLAKSPPRSVPGIQVSGWAIKRH